MSTRDGVKEYVARDDVLDILDALTPEDADVSHPAHRAYQQVAALLAKAEAPDSQRLSGVVDEGGPTNAAYRIWNDLAEFLSFLGPHDNKYKAIAVIQSRIVEMLNNEGITQQAVAPPAPEASAIIQDGSNQHIVLPRIVPDFHKHFLSFGITFVGRDGAEHETPLPEHTGARVMPVPPSAGSEAEPLRKRAIALWDTIKDESDYERTLRQIETFLRMPMPAETDLDRLKASNRRARKFDRELIQRGVKAALEEAAATICQRCDLKMPMNDAKHHIGPFHCYAWAIRAIDPEVVAQRAGEGSKTE